MSERVCPACRETKSLDLFSKDKRQVYCLACHNQKQKVRSEIRRNEVLAHYSGGFPVCACCSETRVEFLTIDHIENGGTQLRKTVKGHKYITYWLRREGFPPGYRVLCMNCNHARGRYGRCPHEVEKESLTVTA